MGHHQEVNWREAIFVSPGRNEEAAPDAITARAGLLYDLLQSSLLSGPAGHRCKGTSGQMAAGGRPHRREELSGAVLDHGRTLSRRRQQEAGYSRHQKRKEVRAEVQYALRR